MASTACPLMRPRRERNPKMATAHEPIQRPDTYQRLPRTCENSIANSSRFIHRAPRRCLLRLVRTAALEKSFYLWKARFLRIPVAESVRISDAVDGHRAILTSAKIASPGVWPLSVSGILYRPMVMLVG